jgi:hypothetical protein
MEDIPMMNDFQQMTIPKWTSRVNLLETEQKKPDEGKNNEK